MTTKEKKEFLDEKVNLYNNPNFIDSDPVQIPHAFSKKEDIEIAGFLAATIAWGNRKMIIKNATKMMELMGNSPHDFIMNHTEKDLESLEKYCHRTFNGVDFQVFTKGLKHIYTHHGGLEAQFIPKKNQENYQQNISDFKKLFFETSPIARTRKHISDPISGSAAKRINMFLRWMIRKDNNGVDLGIWKKASPALLSCPLDVHSGNVARVLGLLHRSKNDAKAVAELDLNLRELDKTDPVKYDFALFGLGVFEGFSKIEPEKN